MIQAFVGRMGSGKTLSMTREAFILWRQAKREGKDLPVYTNYDVNFPHTKLDFEELFEIAQNQRVFNDMIILLDEVHIVLDSRSGMTSLNKIITFWLNQTRKQSIVLMYTTQYEHQVDKRLRSGTDIWIYCQGQKVKRKNGAEYFVVRNTVTNGEKVENVTFIGNTWYNLYDTTQVIKFVNKKKAYKDAAEKGD